MKFRNYKRNGIFFFLKKIFKVINSMKEMNRKLSLFKIIRVSFKVITQSIVKIIEKEKKFR